VSVGHGVLAAGAEEDLAVAREEGAEVHLGVVPATDDRAPSAKQALERVLRLLDMLGLGPGEVADRLVLTPGCGLAGASSSYARTALEALRTAAAELG
jgi:methionine synthase II (cobalamin-independent)